MKKLIIATFSVVILFTVYIKVKNSNNKEAEKSTKIPHSLIDVKSSAYCRYPFSAITNERDPKMLNIDHLGQSIGLIIQFDNEMGGVFKIPFKYNAVNCWGNEYKNGSIYVSLADRRTFFEKKSLPPELKECNEIYIVGIVDEVYITAPRNACDETSAAITLSDYYIDLQKTKELN